MLLSVAMYETTAITYDDKEEKIIETQIPFLLFQMRRKVLRKKPWIKIIQTQFIVELSTKQFVSHRTVRQTNILRI